MEINQIIKIKNSLEMENNKISLQANQMKNKDREKKLKHQSRK